MTKDGTICSICRGTGLAHTRRCACTWDLAGKPAPTFQHDIERAPYWYGWQWCRCRKPCAACNGTGRI
jgi:hypothetical protein